MRRRSWQRRLAIWGGGAIAVFALVSVAVHVPLVQHAMGWTDRDGTAACPFGHGAPASKIARAPRPGPRAPARPALGFALGATTRAEVVQWAATHGVACEPQRRARTLACSDVPAALLAEHGSALAGTSTWFELDERDLVTAIKTVRRAAHPAAVAEAFAATAHALRSATGAPRTTRGAADAAALGRAAFAQATVEHAFADYRALVRATNLGDGYVLTESYAAR